MKYCIAWSFSTWKTTLSNDIKKITNNDSIHFIEELERTISLKYWGNIANFSKEDRKKFQLDMIFTQIKIEKEINKKTLLNNSLFTTLAYSKFAFNQEEFENLKIIVKEHLIQNPYLKVFHLPIEFEIEQDWIRHTDKKFQTQINEILLNLYKEFNINPIIISGWIEERVKQLKKEL